MEYRVIENRADLAEIYSSLQGFIREERPKFASQVLDVLLSWFDNFQSNEEVNFAFKRGINFFGKKSNLQSLFFVILIENNQIIAFAPFFRFHVTLGSDVGCLEVLSFCPDSTIFFYNEILIRKGCEDRAIAKLLEIIFQKKQEAPFVLLLNHMPAFSGQVPIIGEQIRKQLSREINVGISPIYRRGGLYPWNINSLITLLKRNANDDQLDEESKRRIEDVLEDLHASNHTMLFFRQNHLKVKSQIYNIFKGARPSNRLLVLFDDLERFFQSLPVKYPYLDLPDKAEDFETSLSQSKQYYYRRYRRQFVNSGGRFIKKSGGDVKEEDMAAFIRLHEERWHKHSNILNPLTKAFILEYLAIMARNNLLTLMFAVLKDLYVAGVCLLDFPERREFLSSGRIKEEPRWRAGKLLLYEALVDAIAQKIPAFDFGYGDEGYKTEFNCSFNNTFAIAVFYRMRNHSLANIFSAYEEISF